MGPLLIKGQSKNYLRSVTKSGFCGIKERRRIRKYTYYTTDLFTSLVNLRWRYILLICIVSFISTWFIFGVLWWVIAYAHGDLKTSPYENSEPEPCVTLVEDMTSAFLFSLETQYTTGYGTRSPTPQCPEAVFLLCVQSIFGLLLQSVMVGVVFAKLARPKARSQAIFFSEKATVCLRDGRFCLTFRVADVRKSCLVGCKIRAWILKHRISKEGEALPYYQTKLKISVEDGGSDFFLLWPVTVVHKIDERSPFYRLNARELLRSQFEIVVSLVCTVETTGQTTEVRTSYTPPDILWGHRFQNIIVRNEMGIYVDYALFDKTTCVDMMTCSGSQLEAMPAKKLETESLYLYTADTGECLAKEEIDETCRFWCPSDI
ncbi:ATP-sensitive inward rectifier potassium channel 12-like isoform X2 [Cimex lectularius]|uniref:Uncharacterized protein n=1 Tax=Cimex lectularius TaxID=79782 RepID=A0A8I6RN46_CIMLE|nr:ATP-sensitive inward rectifier potassium channel 12-like isoform X2 [Cimex lectularius]